MKVVLLVGIVAVLLFGCSHSSKTVEIPAFSQDEFLVRNLTKAVGSFGYRVFVPKDRLPGERLPVMLYLHGADERGSDNQRQLQGLAEQIRSHPQDFRFIIVFPQCPLNRFWDKELMWLAEDALQQAITEFDGDESRLYLAGFSLGGYGVWTRAVVHPTEFAAIVPISGRVLPRPGERKDVASDVLGLADAKDPYLAYAERIVNVPIWIFQGADDRIVPPDGSRRMAQALKNAGNENVVFSELPGVGHYAVDAAFGNPELFKWLAKQRRSNISYENLEVIDDVVYGQVIGAIAYDGEEHFGSIGGGTLVHVKRETISPESPNEIDSIPDLASDIRNEFLRNNREGDKLRGDGYDAKVYFSMTEQSGSLADIYDHNKSVDPKLFGVVGLSKVGYDANHSRSLVYVEFYNPKMKLVRNYCLINWKRDGNGLMVAGKRWLL